MCNNICIYIYICKYHNYKICIHPKPSLHKILWVICELRTLASHQNVNFATTANPGTPPVAQNSIKHHAVFGSFCTWIMAAISVDFLTSVIWCYLILGIPDGQKEDFLGIPDDALCWWFGEGLIGLSGPFQGRNSKGSQLKKAAFHVETSKKSQNITNVLYSTLDMIETKVTILEPQKKTLIWATIQNLSFSNPGALQHK